jgi:hypothetical protein
MAGTGCIQLKTLSTDKVFAEQASIMTAHTNTFASSRIDLDAIEFVQLDDSVQGTSRLRKRKRLPQLELVSTSWPSEAAHEIVAKDTDNLLLEDKPVFCFVLTFVNNVEE